MSVAGERMVSELTDNEKDNIARRYTDVHDRVERAAIKAQRQVKLVVVSKTFSAAHVDAVYGAGARAFGENYAQELVSKAQQLSARDIEWHFIGRFQSNKINMLAPYVRVWQTIASAAHLEALSKRVDATHAYFLQVNVSDEPQKAGVTCAQILQHARSWVAASPLKFVGLMCIPDKDSDVDGFRRLALTARELEQQIGRPVKLSMGMSADFEAAIMCGSDLVRVGSAIFGQRLVAPAA